MKLLEKEWFWTLGIVLICFLSRLPLFSSPFIRIDEDECAAGLMALHAAQGKEMPFYFLGQSYGFAWLETLTTALAFKVFGAGVWPMQMAMLMLWTAGCCLYYRAAAYLTDKTYAFMVMVLFVLSPSWMAWSLKARSGYITAFLLSAIVIFWIIRRERPLGIKTWACIGALFGLIYYSQPGFAPLAFIGIVFVLRERRSWKSAVSCLIGLVSIVILAKVMLLFQQHADLWQPDIFGGPKDRSFAGFRMRIYGALSQGSKDAASGMIVLIWHVLFAAGCVLQAINLLKKRAEPWATLFFVSIIMLLGSTFFMNKNIYGNRYMLAMSVCLALWFGTLYFHWFKERVLFRTFFTVLFSAFIVLGTISSLNFRDHYRVGSDNASARFSETQKIAVLINFLQSHGIKHVYCADYELNWKLLFLSKEGIISRWIKIDRVPEYSLAVDVAFRGGQPVALVGTVDPKETFAMVSRDGNTSVLEEQYFVRLSPSQGLIFDKFGFGDQLNKINN